MIPKSLSVESKTLHVLHGNYLNFTRRGVALAHPSNRKLVKVLLFLFMAMLIARWIFVA
jgi:hypothetical protein